MIGARVAGASVHLKNDRCHPVAGCRVMFRSDRTAPAPCRLAAPRTHPPVRPPIPFQLPPSTTRCAGQDDGSP